MFVFLLLILNLVNAPSHAGKIIKAEILRPGCSEFTPKTHETHYASEGIPTKLVKITKCSDVIKNKKWYKSNFPRRDPNSCSMPIVQFDTRNSHKPEDKEGLDKWGMLKIFNPIGLPEGELEDIPENFLVRTCSVPKHCEAHSDTEPSRKSCFEEHIRLRDAPDFFAMPLASACYLHSQNCFSYYNSHNKDCWGLLLKLDNPKSILAAEPFDFYSPTPYNLFYGCSRPEFLSRKVSTPEDCLKVKWKNHLRHNEIFLCPRGTSATSVIHIKSAAKSQGSSNTEDEEYWKRFAAQYDLPITELTVDYSNDDPPPVKC
jgi:hypothetical protein